MQQIKAVHINALKKKQIMGRNYKKIPHTDKDSVSLIFLKIPNDQRAGLKIKQHRNFFLRSVTFRNVILKGN